MKKIYVPLSLITPFIIYFIFTLHWPSWIAVIIAGFLISLTIPTEKIFKFIKFGLLSLAMFSAVFALMVEILRPDSQARFGGVFVAYFVTTVMFSAIGYLAGFLGKSLVLKIFKRNMATGQSQQSGAK